MLPALLLLAPACSSLACGPGTARVGEFCVATERGGSDTAAPRDTDTEAPPDTDPGDTDTADTADTDTAATPGDPVVEVYLLVGQSNMNGWAPATGLPPSLLVAQPDARIYWSMEGALRPLAPSSSKGLQYAGPEVTLGRTLADAGRDVVLVKDAWDGVDLATWWYPGADAADPAVGEGWLGLMATLADAAEALDAEGRPWRWAGVTVLQGENDAWDPDAAAAFGDNLALFVRRLREELATPDLPVVIGALHCDTQCPDGELVLAGQEAVAAADPAVTLVDTSDLYGIPTDPKHFDGPSMRVLGARFAETFLGEPPSPAPSAAVALTAWTADRTGAYTLGWRFTTAAPLTVTDVASFGETELAATTEWGLWDLATTSLVARGVVPGVDEAPTSWRDGFWYVAVEPFTLAPGDYVIAIATWDDDGNTHANACVGTVGSALTYVEGRYMGGENGWLAFPENPGGRALAFMGPGFLYLE